MCPNPALPRSSDSYPLAFFVTTTRENRFLGALPLQLRDTRFNVWPHPAGISNILTELFRQPHVLEPQAVDSRKCPKHLLTVDQRGIISRDCLGKASVLARVCGAID